MASWMGLHTEKKSIPKGLCGTGKTRRGRMCIAQLSAAEDKALVENDKLSGFDELATDSIAASLSESDIILDKEHDFTDNAPPKVSDTRDQGTKLSLLRAGGTLMTPTTVGREILHTLGVAGFVVGAVSMIIDFVDQNSVGGAIGAVGFAAGVASGLAISSPLGWIKRTYRGFVC